MTQMKYEKWGLHLSLDSTLVSIIWHIGFSFISLLDFLAKISYTLIAHINSSRKSHTFMYNLSEKSHKLKYEQQGSQSFIRFNPGFHNQYKGFINTKGLVLFLH